MLRKNFSDIPIFEDVTKITKEDLDEIGRIDLLTGGFPCQDLSYAKTNAEGLAGKRSGLFFEIVRLARVARPQYLLLENVTGLYTRGLGVVLGELAEAGYNARWQSISCEEVGGVHRRERVWIIATNTDRERVEGTRPEQQTTRVDERDRNHGSDIKSRICREDDGIPGWLDGHLMKRNQLPDFWDERLIKKSEKKKNHKHRLMGLGNAVVPQVAYIPLMQIVNDWKGDYGLGHPDDV